MPAPDQIDPSLLRERMLYESDAEYADRMKRLDARQSFFATLIGAED